MILTHPRRPGTTLHQHDFAELTYILEGAGSHWVNGQVQPLQAGDIICVRPDDCHTICARAGGRLRYINVAFGIDLWRQFRQVAALEQADALWNAAPLPPTVRVPPEQRAQCAEIFHRILRASQVGPSRLVLCRFWTEILPLLLPERTAEPAVNADMPLWLVRVCQAMQDPDNLQIGLPRLVDISGVSPEHLARTFRRYYGQTPTEFINALRLKRAETLLLTTSQEIVEIAYDCGFGNLSYFYRRFHRCFGKTPRAFRQDARRSPLPPH